MKNENIDQNAESTLNPPLGVRAACAALLLSPICLGLYLWYSASAAHPVQTLLRALTHYDVLLTRFDTL